MGCEVKSHIRGQDKNLVVRDPVWKEEICTCHKYLIMCKFSGGSRISPRWGRQLSGGGGTNIRFCQKFPKNCMKLKEFGPPPGGLASLAPPLKSATGNLLKCETAELCNTNVTIQKNLESTYESHQNCLKIYFMNISRIFGDPCTILILTSWNFNLLVNELVLIINTPPH